MICIDENGLFNEAYKVHPEDDVVRTNRLPHNFEDSSDKSGELWQRRKNLVSANFVLAITLQRKFCFHFSTVDCSGPEGSSTTKTTS